MFDYQTRSEVDETKQYREQAVQAGLARLLATENLFVQFRHAHTATMNVQTRVLTIPIFSRSLSKSTVTMLVGHEVGHALFSPCLDAGHFHDGLNKYGKAFKGYINVVEDARIERLIQQKYPGLRKDFLSGYKELLADGFFGPIFNLGGMYLIDRVNLYFKVGPHLGNFMFTEREMEIVNAIAKAATFDEVVALSRKMYDIDKARRIAERSNQPKPTKRASVPEDVESGIDDIIEDIIDSLPSLPPVPPEQNEELNRPAPKDSMTMDDIERDEDMDGPEPDVKTDTSDPAEDRHSTTIPKNTDADEEADGEVTNDIGNSPVADIDIDEEMESETDNAFRDKEASLIDHTPGAIVEPKYYRIDALDYHDATISYKAILKSLQHPEQYSYRQLAIGLRDAGQTCSVEEYLAECKNQFRLKFVEKHNKHINHLVREFELKKNAWQQSRAQQANVGTLNMNRIWQYKFVDDVFNKVTNLPKGKNHGMLLLIDFSGSMNKVIQDVVEQAMVMAMFCRRVGISCRAYGFTSTNGTHLQHARELEGITAGNKKFVGQILSYQVSGHSTLNNIELFELVNERMSNKEFNDMLFWFCNKPSHQTRNQYKGVFKSYKGKIVALPLSANKAFDWVNHASYLIHMGGTPLHEAIILSSQIMNEMNSGMTKIQNMNMMVLTDGEGGDLPLFNGEGNRSADYKDDTRYFLSPFSGEAYRISDSETPFAGGSNYGNKHYNEFRQLINMVKDHNKCTAIGYYLMENDYINRYTSHYEGFFSKSRVDLQKEYTDNGYTSIDGLGFDEYFFLSDNLLEQKDRTIDKIEATVRDEDDEDEEGAPIASQERANQFIDISKKNKANRHFLKKFIELIA